MKYQALDWDTDFFDIKIARITDPDLVQNQPGILLNQLKSKGFKLVYWASEEEVEQEYISSFGGRLVDVKTTFVRNIDESSLSNSSAFEEVKPYSPSISMEDLEELAIQSGECSRFNVDGNIPKEKFKDLYKTWIRRSVNQEIADEVLVIQEQEKAVGMITLAGKDGCGDIGLVSIHQSCRGKGYGKQLVHSAIRWFETKGYSTGQVVTQGKNIPACRLYERCGFGIEKQQYFYHFWL